jgi:Ankyrin repeats (3 copies)/Ankyrin repeats (many copies)
MCKFFVGIVVSILFVCLSGCITYTSIYRNPEPMNRSMGMAGGREVVQSQAIRIKEQPSSDQPDAALTLTVTQEATGPEEERTAYSERVYENHWSPLLMISGAVVLPFDLLAMPVLVASPSSPDEAYGCPSSFVQPFYWMVGSDACNALHGHTYLMQREGTKTRLTGRTTGEQRPASQVPVQLRLLAKYEDSSPDQIVSATVITDDSGQATVVLDDALDQLIHTPHAVTIQLAVASGPPASAEVVLGHATMTALTRTTLIRATQYGRTDTVLALLAKGSPVDVKGSDGRTALIVAAANNRADILQILLARGAEINASDEQGQTALMLAARNGYSDLVRILLAKGADERAMDHNGETAMVYASTMCHADVVQMLLAKILIPASQAEQAGHVGEALRRYITILRSLPNPLPDNGLVWRKIVSLYRALKVKPGVSGEARRLWVQADALAKNGRNLEAINNLGQTIKLAPSYAAAHFNLAVLNGHEKHYREAIVEMQRYLDLDPDAPDAREAKNLINQWTVTVK